MEKMLRSFDEKLQIISKIQNSLKNRKQIVKDPPNLELPVITNTFSTQRGKASQAYIQNDAIVNKIIFTNALNTRISFHKSSFRRSSYRQDNTRTSLKNQEQLLRTDPLDALFRPIMAGEKDRVSRISTVSPPSNKNKPYFQFGKHATLSPLERKDRLKKDPAKGTTALERYSPWEDPFQEQQSDFPK